jgi:hypothetical protein
MLLCIAALVVVVVIGLPESNRSVLRPGRKEFTGRRIAQTTNGAVLKEKQEQITKSRQERIVDEGYTDGIRKYDSSPSFITKYLRDP